MPATVTDQKELITSFFDRASQRGYGRLSYFPVFGERLVKAARIAPGANVRDVASGWVSPYPTGEPCNLHQTRMRGACQRRINNPKLLLDESP